MSILLSRSYVIGIVPERDDTARDSVSGSFVASMTLGSAMLTTLSSFFVALHPSTVEVLVLTLAGSSCPNQLFLTRIYVPVVIQLPE